MEYLIMVNDMEFGSFASLPYKNKGENTALVKVQCIVAIPLYWMGTHSQGMAYTTQRSETSWNEQNCDKPTVKLAGLCGAMMMTRISSQLYDISGDFDLIL